MLYSFANLNADNLQDIQGLEKEIGAPLVAMAQVQGTDAASISEDQVTKIRELEKRLGVVLLAVQ